MGLNIKTTTNKEVVAEFIFASITKQLELHKRVLFFVTGGSSIAVGVKVAELLRNYPEKDLLKNLTITLTDERYGEVGHRDSNWQQLLEQGFNLPLAKLIPILTGNDLVDTTRNFSKVLEKELKLVEDGGYALGLFGMGKDGHTAGILPNSRAAQSLEMAFGYDSPPFTRITMTPKAIERLGEAVLYTQGSEKWEMLENLEKNIDIIKMPAQVLKKVPLLTIFTDKK